MKEDIKYITVAEFIIKYGIEKLKDYPIEIGKYRGKIHLSEFDLEFHNKRKFNNENRHKEGRFEQYHRKGNYRFYAICWDQQEKRAYAPWVNKTALVIDYDYYIKNVLLNQPPVIKYQVNRRTTGMHTEVQSEEIFVEHYATVRDALKSAEFKAKQLSQSGYYGEITYMTGDNKWHFHKPIEAKK